MECELTEPLAFPEPEHVGVRVEILPDLYVEMDTARRIHALLLCLVGLIVILVLGRVPALSLSRALSTRPLLAGPVDAPCARNPRPVAPRPPAPSLPFLEGFLRARKRALEVLQYAITTAPPELRASGVELSSDAADPFNPAGFRLRVTCAPQDPTVTRGFLENLRVILPGVALGASEDPVVEELVIDSHPRTAEPPPAITSALALPLAPLARGGRHGNRDPRDTGPGASAPSVGPGRSPGSMRLGSPGEISRPPAPPRSDEPGEPDAGGLPPPVREVGFPFAAAIAAPSRGKLIPLFPVVPQAASPASPAAPSPEAAATEADEVEEE